MRTEDLPLEALEHALIAAKDQALQGLVHHSDRGSQYVSIRYSERLEEAGITPSVGSRCGVSRFLDSLVMRPGSHVLFVVPMLVLGFGIPARSGDGSGCRRLRCTQRLYGGQGLD